MVWRYSDTLVGGLASEQSTTVRSPGSRFQEGHERSGEKISDRCKRETFPTDTGNEEAVHWSPSTEHCKGNRTQAGDWTSDPPTG
ncbi:hypothetical protein ATANTOWER_023870 [Ataeniobius toweri]|uniref:Uncharacterized protein n=1 Tax=Ataeniobius toweri TaxID=208326 RepID=A0ABU7AZD2_9TELE|nr:hypothetical protein [Ataeniobius toweri]